MFSKFIYYFLFNLSSSAIIFAVTQSSSLSPSGDKSAFDIVGRKLTDAMLHLLSQRISSPGQLRTVATKGLNMEQYVLDKYLHNEKDIDEAAFKVLKEWRVSQENSAVGLQHTV